MSEEQIKAVVRSFSKSYEDGDVPKCLSFMTQDIVYVTPEGTFKGITEVQRYLDWITQTNKGNKITEIGIGVLVQGNTAIIEHNIAGTYKGNKWEIPGVGIYEFSGDKIQKIRGFHDRLSLAKQATKGFPKMVVNLVVRGSVRGLR